MMPTSQHADPWQVPEYAVAGYFERRQPSVVDESEPVDADQEVR